MSAHIIGIDTGPLVGMGLLRLPTKDDPVWYAEVAQVAPSKVPEQIAAWLDAHVIVAVASERFVVGPLAARVGTARASQAARDVQGMLTLAVPREVRQVRRSAAEVKPWATDDRLKAAGLYEPTKGKRHARDAIRHALFSACRDYGARHPRIGALT